MITVLVMLALSKRETEEGASLVYCVTCFFDIVACALVTAGFLAFGG